MSGYEMLGRMVVAFLKGAAVAIFCIGLYEFVRVCRRRT